MENRHHDDREPTRGMYVVDCDTCGRIALYDDRETDEFPARGRRRKPNVTCETTHSRIQSHTGGWTMSNDDSPAEIPQEAKDLTPMRGTVERLYSSVIESDDCTMARSGGYRVEQEGDEIVVYREPAIEYGRWDCPEENDA